jgi:hypothetical protein
MTIYWATTYTPITKGNVALIDTSRKFDVELKKQEKN